MKFVTEYSLIVTKQIFIKKCKLKHEYKDKFYKYSKAQRMQLEFVLIKN